MDVSASTTGTEGSQAITGILHLDWFTISLVLAGVFLLVGARDRFGTRGRLRSVAGLIYFGIAATLAGSAGTWWLLIHGDWSYLLAFVPPVIMARQGLYLRLIRRRVFDQRSDPKPRRGATEESDDQKLLAQRRAEARLQHDREFSTDALAVRFGIPALLALLAGFGLVWVVSQDHTALHIHERALMGARYAAAGAYTYVLLFLGQRAMQRDVTSGAAMWSAVTLVVGPLLGAVVSLIWLQREGFDATNQPWSYKALFFVAGLAPRETAALIQEVARRLWPTSAPAEPIPKVKALTQIHGIGNDIAQRLGEEGISDVYSLAMADPLKLFRNTNFDKQQILAWIDEALLLYYAEPWAERLAKIGIVGAVNVAYHAAGKGKDAFDGLCAAMKLEKTDHDALEAVGKRLFTATQVTHLWAIYDGVDEDTDAEAEPSLPRAPLTVPLSPASGDVLWEGPLAASIVLVLVLAVAAWDARLDAATVQRTVLFGGIAFCAGLLLALSRATFEVGGAPDRKALWVVFKVLVPLSALLLLFGVMPWVWYGGAFAPEKLWKADVNFGAALFGAALAMTGFLVFRVWFTSIHATLRVNVAGEPSDVSVEVDGALLDRREDKSYRVRRGDLAITVRVKGHAPTTQWVNTRRWWSGSINVSLKDHCQIRIAHPRDASLPVRLEVDGDAVTRDAESQAFHVSAATHSFVVAVRGYRPVELATVECPAGGIVWLNLPEMEALPSTVRLRYPEGGVLAIDVATDDGKSILKGWERSLPTLVVEVAAGTRALKLSSAGYAPETISGPFIPGQVSDPKVPVLKKYCTVIVDTGVVTGVKVKLGARQIDLDNGRFQATSEDLASADVILEADGYEKLARRLQPGAEGAEVTFQAVLVKKS